MTPTIPKNGAAPAQVLSNIKAAAPKRRSRPMVDVADEILAFSRMPRLSWGFAELDDVAPFPTGSAVVVMGATGRGKSAFLLQSAFDHASHRGPVLVVSAELIAAVAAGRIVAQRTGHSWLEVMRGVLDVDAMKRVLATACEMRIMDEVPKDVLAAIASELELFTQDYPDQSALVVVDYLQLLPSEAPDPRERVSSNMVSLRQLAARFRAGVMVISKAARSAARMLRSGEAMGLELTEAGAETNAIEHEAVAMIALGAMRPENENEADGPEVVDVSVVKARFGQADKIVPLRFEGARGLFTAVGSAVNVTDRRNAQKAAVATRRVETLENAIENVVRTSQYPLSRAEIARTVIGANVDKAAAIERLLVAHPPRLVLVCGDGVKKRGGSWPIWSPERVAANPRFRVVPKAVVDG